MMMEKAHHTVSAQRYKDVGIKFYYKIFAQPLYRRAYWSSSYVCYRLGV